MNFPHPNAVYSTLSQLAEDRPTYVAVRQIADVLTALNGRVTNLEARPQLRPNSVANLTIQQVQQQLQAGGPAPLNLNNLPGSPAPTLSDTHANRLAKYPASGQPLGTLFVESDRHLTYVVEVVSGANTWVFVGGVYEDLIANRPTDLGTNDVGVIFFATDATQATNYIWTGSAWITVGGLLQIVADGATNTVSTVRQSEHSTSGVAAAGFGSRDLVQLENAAGSLVSASAFDTQWSNAGAGTEAADLTLYLARAGALTQLFKLFGATGVLAVALLQLSSKVIEPLADAVTAIQITKADGTTVIFNVDSSNKRVGINTTAPAVDHDVNGVANARTGFRQSATGASPTAGHYLRSDGTNFVDGTVALADLPNTGPGAGTYTVGAKLTGAGTNGSITINAQGIITAITQAT